MNNLANYILGDVCRVINGRAYSQHELLEIGKYKVLRVGNFFSNSSWYYSDLELDNDKYCNFGDLLFAWSASFGPRIWDEGKTIYHYHIWKMIPKDEVINKKYLYYFLQNRIKSMLKSTHGSIMLHLTKEYIEGLKITLPKDVAYQNNVASVLSDIDSKIELNNKVNAELESMTKTLYEYWFVQFDFPDKNGKPYKSSGGKIAWNKKLKINIPCDWKVIDLEGLIDFSRGISYTSKDIESLKGIPMINLASIDVNRNYRPNELKYYSGKYSLNKLISQGDLLIACTDLTQNADIIGSPIIVPNLYNKYLYSMDLAKINILVKDIVDIYLYMTLRTDFYHKYIKYFASGTNVLHLNLNGILWYPIVVPPHELQLKFANIISPFIRKQATILNENAHLSKLRDWLLPMLMNGQVKVTN